jgi:signal transduction histidine kinase
MLVTPITAGERRLGVIAAYGLQSSLFANDDLTLLRVLAGQIATYMVMRELMTQAATVQAREEATRLKEDFLSAAAHDLKTPLTTLLGQAQLMQRRLRGNPEWRPDPAGVDRMAEEAMRMRRLVEDLLEASRSERGGFIAERRVVDLEALAREVVAQAPAQDHELVVVGGPALMVGDRNRMRQVVQNLVENAVKYSPDGGRVTVEVAQKDGEARLTVCDEGVGIPEDDLVRIFERFQRGARANDRRFPGMGVGLYLCKSIVEEHGGRIWAESELGSGSQFHVSMPACEREGE